MDLYKAMQIIDMLITVHLSNAIQTNEEREALDTLFKYSQRGIQVKES